MKDFKDIFMGNDESIERKGKLFIYGIEDRLNASLDIIRNRYENYQKLKKAIDYITYLHSDTIKADVFTLQKVGYYPATETAMELDHSIKHALIGSYKSAFGDLRRALE